MKPGTDSTDSECGEHCPQAGLVAGIVSEVILGMGLIIAIIHRKKIKGKCYIKLTCIMVTANMYHGYIKRTCIRVTLR
jgi:hypothetical protein